MSELLRTLDFSRKYMKSAMMIMTTTMMITLIMLRNHTLSPSLCTSSTVSKRKNSDSSDLCATLTKFTASCDKSDSENTTKKKQLTVFFEDIAQTMAKFREVELAETKIEIFNLVNKKKIELLMHKQS